MVNANEDAGWLRYSNKKWEAQINALNQTKDTLPLLRGLLHGTPVKRIRYPQDGVGEEGRVVNVRGEPRPALRCHNRARKGTLQRAHASGQTRCRRTEEGKHSTTARLRLLGGAAPL